MHVDAGLAARRHRSGISPKGLRLVLWDKKAEALYRSGAKQRPPTTRHSRHKIEVENIKL